MSELAKGCEHFLEYRQNHGLQSFKIIYKYLVKPGQEARKLKVRCVRVVAFALQWADTPQLNLMYVGVYARGTARNVVRCYVFVWAWRNIA